MWVYYVSIEDRKEVINLRRRTVRDSIISSLEEDEAISGIVKDRVGRAIISFQSGFLNVKLSIRIIIIIITIFIIVIIIIIVFFTLSRAVTDIGSKVLINLVWQ